MQSEATTVNQYLAGLPPDRRDALQQVRAVILKSLPKGYEEGMQYGMIGYYVPLRVYPPGYHCANPQPQPLPFGGLASQKNHMSLYLMCHYGDTEREAWFRDEWKKTGKKLDMGKSCIRFKRIEDVALDVIAKAIKRAPVKKYIVHYENAIMSPTSKRAAQAGKRKNAAASKTKAGASKTAKSASKQPSAKKATKRKTAKKAAKRPSTSKATQRKSAKPAARRAR
jgi:hypothetical protein